MKNSWSAPGSISSELDIEGINYTPEEYDIYHKTNPNQPLVGSETASQVTDRGFYVNNPTSGHLWGYDLWNPDIYWGVSAEDAWQPIIARDFVMGGFVWTGFDYKGEPSPYTWPDTNSHFGNLDLAGFPKDGYFWYQTWWTPQPPATSGAYHLHLFPHWNWSPGSIVDMVWVYSNVEQVELFVNGVSQGERQDMEAFDHVQWDQVPYYEGILSAVGYVQGIMVANTSRMTTGPAAVVSMHERVVANRPGLKADGLDVAMVEVVAVDGQGQVVPTATSLVSFTIQGPGSIYGVGNGDPASLNAVKETRSVTLWAGQALLLVTGTDGKPGDILITATSEGLADASLTLKSFV
jgi:beta-galactosidase